MRTLLILGCGRSKLDRPAFAADLYKGPLFSIARSWARARLGAQDIAAWAIASAEHGLIAPDCWLAPYDRTLKTQAEALAWGEQVGAQLAFQIRALDIDAVELVAGRRYREAIRQGLGLYRQLAQRVEVREPFASLGIGYQRQAIGAQLAEIARGKACAA